MYKKCIIFTKLCSEIMGSVVRKAEHKIHHSTMSQLRISGRILIRTKIERDIMSGQLWGPNFCMDYVWKLGFVRAPATLHTVYIH